MGVLPCSLTGPPVTRHAVYGASAASWTWHPGIPSPAPSGRAQGDQVPAVPLPSVRGVTGDGEHALARRLVRPRGGPSRSRSIVLVSVLDWRSPVPRPLTTEQLDRRPRGHLPGELRPDGLLAHRSTVPRPPRRAGRGLFTSQPPHSCSVCGLGDTAMSRISRMGSALPGRTGYRNAPRPGRSAARGRAAVLPTGRSAGRLDPVSSRQVGGKATGASKRPRSDRAAERCRAIRPDACGIRPGDSARAPHAGSAS